MSRRDKIILSLLLSLILHFLLLGFGSYWSYRHPPELKKPDVVQVDLLEKNQSYQIADIEPPKVEKRPEKAKFVGMYDSSVPEETVAPSRKPVSHPGVERKSVAEKAKGFPDDGPSLPIPKIGQKKEPKKVAMKRPEEEAVESARERVGAQEDYFNPGMSEDYFPDYKVADRTYLNVLRFPKVSYFVRLKKIFRTTFNPIPSLRAVFMSTQVSKGQVDVVLAVTLDRAGKLSELKILRSSGLQGYDQEAVRTIRDSAPFAAPPGELLDAGGLLRMAWTFTVFL